MVGKIIRDYMEGGNKKLTVPGFGTFMRKDSGEVIFVDLLRKDDGKLRELVEDYGRYGEVEAMALVDRFIFETKNSIEKNGSAPVDGFGTMFLDDKGLYQFDYAPKAETAKPVKENPVQEQLFPKEEPQPRPVQKTADKPVKTSSSVRPAASMPTKAEGGFVHEAMRRPPKKTKGKGSKPDMLILIAIIVAAIAILIMIFGLSTGNMPFLNK